MVTPEFKQTDGQLREIISNKLLVISSRGCQEGRDALTVEGCAVFVS